MRVLLAICCATIIATSVHAQKQERSLIDRLLRPDMTSKNASQDKKFVTRAAPGAKSKTVGAFYVEPRAPEKSFRTLQSYPTTHLHPSLFNSGREAASLPKNQSPRSADTFSTSSTVQVRETTDNDKKVGTRSFADERSFLAQGKSQKALDRKNPPLTVAQVRELLNKNK